MCGVGGHGGQGGQASGWRHHVAARGGMLVRGTSGSCGCCSPAVLNDASITAPQITHIIRSACLAYYTSTFATRGCTPADEGLTSSKDWPRRRGRFQVGNRRVPRATMVRAQGACVKLRSISLRSQTMVEGHVDSSVISLILFPHIFPLGYPVPQSGGRSPAEAGVNQGRSHSAEPSWVRFIGPAHSCNRAKSPTARMPAVVWAAMPPARHDILPS